MRNVTKIAIGLYLFSQTLFLIGIQFPTKVDFDEFHYVPAAKALYQFDKIPNREHPPLAKYLIGIGIETLGDNPPGWRVMSTVFGSITLVGMFFWGLALFRDEKLALWIALLTLVNQLLYVQARIAMLDTFMFAFMVWAFAAFTDTWRDDISEARVRKRLLAAGVLFGLSAACKWYGLMGLLTCVGMIALVYVFRGWGVVFQSKAPAPSVPLKSTDWYSPKLWGGITFQDWLMYLGLIPALVYFATFLPYAFFHEGVPIWKFISFQADMYGDQLRVVGTHPYMSQWKDWPLMSRPIWYAFDQDGAGIHRCVLLLGNPLIMWGGLLALVACAYGVVRDRSREGFLVLFFYLGLFASWMIIPRKVSFYYYYYPAGMVLSMSMAYLFFCWDRRKKAAGGKPIARWVVLGLAAALFIYFFPILSGMKVQGDDFRQYMWSNRWI